MAQPDYTEWEAVTRRIREAKSTPNVVYKTVSMSTAWQQLVEHLEAEQEVKQKQIVDVVGSFKFEKLHTHEALLGHKVLVDIYQAELRVIESLLQTVKTYQEKENA